MTDYVDAKDRATLLKVARNALEACVGMATEREVPDERHGVLARPGACFVTLYRDGQLRGCIGMLEAREPLHRAIRLMTTAAALRDPRFAPVSPAEVSEIRLSLSILTPSKPIRPEQVEVGRDGLVISRGAARGVLLPQVATEQRWNAETFLAHTCLKAGLPRDAWKDPNTTIEAFSAEVFGEAEPASEA
jgi:AmmeMemoRadiSam system protein A